jgi:hypothetical protein
MARGQVRTQQFSLGVEVADPAVPYHLFDFKINVIKIMS